MKNFRKNIFHLARVTEQSPKNIFFKSQYKDCNIFEKYKANPKMFDNISSNSATIEYTNMIKELVDSTPILNTNKILIQEKEHYDGIYEKDLLTVHFEKEIWRSTYKKYIIFWNSKCWTLTGSQYESEISETCGGFKSFDELSSYEN